MPDRFSQPDTLEASLLRKATSIGANNLPEVTEQGMPFSPMGMGGGQISKMLGLNAGRTATKVLHNGWLNPASNLSRGGLFEEMKRLGKISSAHQLVDGIKEYGPDLMKYLNQGIDYTLGYDPNALPVGNPHPAKPQK